MRYRLDLGDARNIRLGIRAPTTALSLVAASGPANAANVLLLAIPAIILFDTAMTSKLDIGIRFY